MIKDLKDIKVKYTSVALPPFPININSIYEIVNYNSEIFIRNGNYEMQIDENTLKLYFSPIDTTWNEIKEKEKENRNSEIYNNNKIYKDNFKKVTKEED